VLGFVRGRPELRGVAREVKRRLPARLVEGWSEERLRFELELPGAGPPAALAVDAPASSFVARELRASGLAAYEPAALACFLAALEAGSPGAVLDVGANIGLYALLAAARSARPAVAFEPTPVLARTAGQVARANGLDVRVERLALGRAPGKATFFLSDATDSSSSLAPGFRPSSRQLTVPVDSLDAWVTRTGTTPGVVKIDTETTEPDVLAGGARALARHRPWILCEVLHGFAEDRLTEVLEPFGYAWYSIRGEAPYAREGRIVGDPALEETMWLFAPAEPGDAFWSAVRTWRAALAACRAPEAGGA
jgi:FkbM family methyltransferase